MTQSVLTFKLLPGKRQEFIETFERLEVLPISSFQAGFLGGEMNVEVNDPDVAMVIARWESPAAYQGWLDNPVRDTLGAELEPFYAEEPRGQLVDSIFEVAPQTPATRA